MARKKKVNAKQNLSYRGDVTVSLMKGNTTISKKQFKNNGYYPLSHFFAYCLANDYTNAETLRPRYIRLFNLGSSGSEAPTTTTEVTELLTSENELTYVQPMYNTTPGIGKVTDATTGEVYFSTTFKFIVPFSQIDSTRDINGLCVYCSSYLEFLNQPNAFFVILEHFA